MSHEIGESLGKKECNHAFALDVSCEVEARGTNRYPKFGHILAARESCMHNRRTITVNHNLYLQVYKLTTCKINLCTMFYYHDIFFVNFVQNMEQNMLQEWLSFGVE